MKKKLKTWEAFEAEFKPFADLWEKRENLIISYIHIEYNDIVWDINDIMKKLFGSEIEVEEYNHSICYTHRGCINYGFAWHELWFEEEFEEIEFLSEEEMEL